MIDFIYIIIVHCTFIVHASHFYGGTVTWKPMNNSATGSTISVMFTQSYQWRRSFGSATNCTESTILNQSPEIGTSGQLNCTTTSNLCGGYKTLSILEYCTDFSQLVDSSSGLITNVENITAGAQFCVAFQGGAWTKLYSTQCSSSGKRKKRSNTGSTMRSTLATTKSTTVSTKKTTTVSTKKTTTVSTTKRTTVSTTTSPGCFSSSAGWSIGTCVNLTLRSDGLINTPPVATVISPIQVPINTITNIQIPVIDADNDFLSCRWAEKTSDLDECGDVCQMVPNGILDDTACSLMFNSTGTSVGDVFAAALMVEDFPDESSYVAYSRVPIQFLIKIVGTPACSLQPTISSNMSACTAVQVGIEFNFTLTITQGCPNTTIDDVFTMPPLYMFKGDLTRIGSTNEWTITETWIPDILQLGSQVYCAVATDSDGIQSDQYCLTFTVVPTGDISLCPDELLPNTTTIIPATPTIITTTIISETESITTIISSEATPIFLSTQEIATSVAITTDSIQISSTYPQTTLITTSITSTTSATTSSVIVSSAEITTLTTTENVQTPATAKPKKSDGINIPLIVGLSLLSLLAILCCCCCYWWWLFGAGARRRRRRRSKQEEEVETKIILQNRKTLFLRKRLLPWLPHKPTYEHIDDTTSATSTTNPRSTISSTNTLSDVTLNSFESKVTRATSLPTNYENSETAMNKGVKVVRISRVDKPSSTEGNKIIKYPVRQIDDDNVSVIDISSISEKRTPTVSVTKLSRSKSLGSNVRVIEAPQPSNSIRQSMISNEKPSGKSKRSHSTNVSRVKRFSEKSRKASIINVIKRSKSTSHVSAVQSSADSRGITIINAPKTSSSISNSRFECENKLSRKNSNIIVTKLSRSKSSMTN